MARHKNSWIVLISVIFMLALGVWGYTASPYKFVIVSGESMSPTLHSGAVVLMDTRLTGNVGDIVVAREPEDWKSRGSSSLIIKRIVAIGDSRIYRGDNGRLYTSNSISAYVGSHENTYTGVTCNATSGEYIHIPQNYIYVVGDNVNNSYDSRVASCDSSVLTHGVVPRENIQGVVILTVFKGGLWG